MKQYSALRDHENLTLLGMSATSSYQLRVVFPIFQDSRELIRFENLTLTTINISVMISHEKVPK